MKNASLSEDISNSLPRIIFSIRFPTYQISSNAQTTPLIQTQLVTLQWDPTHVHACSPGYSGDGTCIHYNSTCIHLISYQENYTQHICNNVVVERNDKKQSSISRNFFFCC